MNVAEGKRRKNNVKEYVMPEKDRKAENTELLHDVRQCQVNVGFREAFVNFVQLAEKLPFVKSTTLNHN